MKFKDNRKEIAVRDSRDDYVSPLSDDEIKGLRSIYKFTPELVEVGQARKDWGGFVRTGGRLRVILGWASVGAVGIAEWKFNILSTLAVKVLS